ncbi:MAG: hypothetical protein IIB00_09735 [candidate division Zixibacteria bacterium]|nr:hypothetical protein [candidate division Zixibacteria bacterium]
MIIYLVSVDWPGAPGDVVPLSALGAAFFSFDQGLFSHSDLNLAGGWHEYGAFLSPVALLLAVWYLLRRFKDYWRWFALAVFFLLLGLGGFAEWSPWKLLGHLPGFGQTRASGRAFQFVLLSVGMLAAFGFDCFMSQMEKENLKRRSRAVAITVIFVFVVGLNLWLALTPISQSFTREPQAPEEWSDDFAQTIGRPERLYNAVLANRGTILVPWLSAYHEGRGLITPERKVLSEYVVRGEVEVNSRLYRGNEIDYRITVSVPGEIALGMGYDPGWKLISHPELDIRDEQGVIAAPFQVGDTALLLEYRTPWFWTSALISLFSLIGVIWLASKLR